MKPIILVVGGPNASQIPKRRTGKPASLRHRVTHQLLGYFLDSFLYRVGDLLDGLLGLPDCLVGLSFVAQLVVAGQRAGGFLDSAFHDVCLATHDDDSFF